MICSNDQQKICVSGAGQNFQDFKIDVYKTYFLFQPQPTASQTPPARKRPGKADTAPLEVRTSAPAAFGTGIDSSIVHNFKFVCNSRKFDNCQYQYGVYIIVRC